MNPVDAVEDYIKSGSSFTYNQLVRISAAHGGVESKDQIANRALQKFRKMAMISLSRFGTAEEIWSLTDLGRMTYGA